MRALLLILSVIFMGSLAQAEENGVYESAESSTPSASFWQFSAAQELKEEITRSANNAIAELPPNGTFSTETAGTTKHP